MNTPSKTDNTYLRACVLMRYYSKCCGAPNPETLRGTELRKQIATACALYNLSEPLVEDIANHLGHHIDIHKKICRQSTAREVPTVVQILLKALGEENVDDDELYKDDLNEVNVDTIDTRDNPCIDTNMSTPITEMQEPSNMTEIDVPQGLIETSTSPNISPKTPTTQLLQSRSSSGNTQVRRSWTTPEKKAIRKVFAHMNQSGIVPTYQECTEIKEQYNCLKARTLPQIKSFVAYESKKANSHKTSGKVRKTWSTPEKQVVRKEFREYMEKKILPSLPKCKEVIASNPVLKSRTPEMLKAYINNLNRKLS